MATPRSNKSALRQVQGEPPANEEPLTPTLPRPSARSGQAGRGSRARNETPSSPGEGGKAAAKSGRTPKGTPLWKPHEIIEILGACYGRAPQQASHDPMFELVLTLLSQHTSDLNSGEAMHRLIEAFPTWDAVMDAPQKAVEDAIRPGGLAPTKSKRLQALLAEVKSRRADWDLAFLAEMPLDEAKAWLTSINGVGPKTAACVLLFALGRPALPVDTHVERVSKRLGLVPATMPAQKAHDALEAMVSPEDVYGFHVDLIQHGRRTCHARGPQCGVCPLAARCPRVGVA